MKLGLTIVFPRAISVAEGMLIEVDGEFTYADRLVALKLVDVARGEVYTSTREEVPDPLNYIGPCPYSLPVVGEIISFSYYNGSTQIYVFPTNQAIYQFNDQFEPLHQLAVPAFWKMFAQQREFIERAGLDFQWPGASRKDTQRPKLYDASDTVVKLFNYFARKRNFHVARCVRYLWASLEKLLVAERHCERLRCIDELRRHVFTASASPERENLLRETEAEAALIVEAVASTLYSSLDILSHVISEVYDLRVSTNNANFMNVVTAKNDDTRRCLERDFPDDPLTAFLLSQRNGWIRELEVWRHYIVHHGCLRSGNYVDSGVLVILPGDEDIMESDPIKMGSNLASSWCKDLKTTLLDSLKMLGQKADACATMPDDELPPGKYSPDLFQVQRCPALETLLSFFDLWQQTEDDEPRRLTFLYSRLDRTWRAEWPFDQFCNFISNHHVTGYRLVGPSGQGNKALITAMVEVSFTSGVQKIGFELIPSQARYALTRTPFSTIPSSIQRVEVTKLYRRQSGRESGFRDVVLGGMIHNITDAQLNEIGLHAFWTELSHASILLDALDPGEKKEFEITWAEACLPIGDYPPISRELLSDQRVFIRTIYKTLTPQGSHWAEDTYYK